MLNRLQTAMIRESVKSAYTQLIASEGAKRKGTVYHPVQHTVIGFNFGTSVRPNVAPINVNANGTETVASFLSRGGCVMTCAPKVAKGATLVTTMSSGTTRVRTSRG